MKSTLQIAVGLTAMAVIEFFFATGNALAQDGDGSPENPFTPEYSEPVHEALAVLDALNVDVPTYQDGQGNWWFYNIEYVPFDQLQLTHNVLLDDWGATFDDEHTIYINSGALEDNYPDPSDTSPDPNPPTGGAPSLGPRVMVIEHEMQHGGGAGTGPCEHVWVVYNNIMLVHDHLRSYIEDNFPDSLPSFEEHVGDQKLWYSQNYDEGEIDCLDSEPKIAAPPNPRDVWGL